MTWYCHVDDLTEGWYDMIIIRYIFDTTGIEIKLTDNSAIFFYN